MIIVLEVWASSQIVRIPPLLANGSYTGGTITMDMMNKNAPDYRRKFQIELGNRIRELRKEHGLTQEELSEAVNISPSFVGSIETGKKVPSLFTLLKIARKLKVSMQKLFMFEPETPIQERNLSELIDLLKSGGAEETKFLLSMAREHRKSYG